MSDETIVRGTLLRAPSGAVQHRVYVPRCPGCGFPHIHHLLVGGDLTSLLRRPRCNPSRPYRIDVVETLPARGVRHAAA
jgi:hypothetical protein